MTEPANKQSRAQDEPMTAPATASGQAISELSSTKSPKRQRRSAAAISSIAEAAAAAACLEAVSAASLGDNEPGVSASLVEDKSDTLTAPTTLGLSTLGGRGGTTVKASSSTTLGFVLGVGAGAATEQNTLGAVFVPNNNSNNSSFKSEVAAMKSFGDSGGGANNILDCSSLSSTTDCTRLGGAISANHQTLAERPTLEPDEPKHARPKAVGLNEEEKKQAANTTRVVHLSSTSSRSLAPARRNMKQVMASSGGSTWVAASATFQPTPTQFSAAAAAAAVRLSGTAEEMTPFFGGATGGKPPLYISRITDGDSANGATCSTPQLKLAPAGPDAPRITGDHLSSLQQSDSKGSAVSLAAAAAASPRKRKRVSTPGSTPKKCKRVSTPGSTPSKRMEGVSEEERAEIITIKEQSAGKKRAARTTVNGKPHRSVQEFNHDPKKLYPEDLTWKGKFVIVNLGSTKTKAHVIERAANELLEKNGSCSWRFLHEKVNKLYWVKCEVFRAYYDNKEFFAAVNKRASQLKQKKREAHQGAGRGPQKVVRERQEEQQEQNTKNDHQMIVDPQTAHQHRERIVGTAIGSAPVNGKPPADQKLMHSAPFHPLNGPADDVSNSKAIFPTMPSSPHTDACLSTPGSTPRKRKEGVSEEERAEIIRIKVQYAGKKRAKTTNVNGRRDQPVAEFHHDPEKLYPEDLTRKGKFVIVNLGSAKTKAHVIERAAELLLEKNGSCSWSFLREKVNTSYWVKCEIFQAYYDNKQFFAEVNKRASQLKQKKKREAHQDAGRELQKVVRERQEEQQEQNPKNDHQIMILDPQTAHQRSIGTATPVIDRPPKDGPSQLEAEPSLPDGIPNSNAISSTMLSSPHLYPGLPSVSSTSNDTASKASASKKVTFQFEDSSMPAAVPNTRSEATTKSAHATAPKSVASNSNQTDSVDDKPKALETAAKKKSVQFDTPKAVPTSAHMKTAPPVPVEENLTNRPVVPTTPALPKTTTDSTNAPLDVDKARIKELEAKLEEKDAASARLQAELNQERLKNARLESRIKNIQEALSGPDSGDEIPAVVTFDSSNA